MEVTLKLKYAKRDRVWMQIEGKKVKGRVVKAILFRGDLYDKPEKIVWTGLNYYCIDEQGNEFVFHEWQLQPRQL